MHTTVLRSWTIVCLALTCLLFPGIASANWVGGIEFGHPSPSWLPHGEYVTVDIDCKVDPPDGARLYAVPYTNGSPSSSYSYTLGTAPTGQSTVTCRFTITAGEEMVDHVRIIMRSADNTTQLLSLSVRVKYVFGPYGIFNIQMSENDHSVLANGDDLTVTCDYGSPGPDNVIVFARPYYGGSLASGYGASGGDPGPADGSASQHFTFGTADADVDQIRIFIKNAANTEVLFEMFHDVDLAWRDVGITNVTFSRPSPSMVHHEDNVDITFDYNNTTGEAIRIWFHPYEDGGYASGGSYMGSTLVAPGVGSAARYIGSTGNTHVNQAHIFVRSDDESEIYIDRVIPVEYTFAPHVVTNVTMTPEAPALLDHDEYLDVQFAYRTDQPDSMLIHAWPVTDGVNTPGGRSLGSGIYLPPSGLGDYQLRIAEGYGEPEVTHLHFAFYTYSEIDFLDNWYLPVTHLWGPSASVMPVPDLLPGGPAMLGQNFPNPFNPLTAIPVTLSGTRHVRLAVYDVRGRLVRVLADEVMGAGRHEIPFDGTGLASGAYYYRLEGAGEPKTGSMTLVK